MANSSFVFTAGLNTRQIDRDGVAAYRRVQGVFNKKLSFNVDPSGLNKLSSPLGKLNSQASEFNRSLEASNARVLAFGASVGIIAALGRGFTALVRDAVEVQSALADINTILKQSADGLSQYEAQIFSVARNTGRSFKETAQAALELSRQGLSAEESLERLNNALILTRLSGISAEDSVESVTAAINSFSKEVLNSSSVLNKFSTVAAKFFVSEKDLAEAVRRVGSSAQDAGVGFDELIALVTAAQQTTARGGAVIGNSLKTIFTRLQRSSTVEDLEELGVAVRDLEGNTLPAIQILQSLSKEIGNLSQPQQAFVSELTAGVFQINQLKAILGDLSGEYSFYRAALDEANNATDEAIKRNSELNKTFAAQFNSIKQSVTQISSILGRDFLGPISKVVEGFATSLEGVFGIKEGEKVGDTFAQGIVKGIGNVLAGPGLLVGLVAVIGLTVKLAKFAGGALRSISDLNSVVGKRKEIQAEINRLVAEEPKLLNQILSGAKSVEEIEKRILGIVRQKIVAQEQFNALTLGIAKGATPRGFNAGTGNLAGAGLRYNGGRLASGPIPNAADPIKAAFDRERAAGVPSNQIYVDSDPRLKSPGNPLGLMIANRRDEPMGGFQGVNRAIALGQDPKRSGMPGSDIPNFALFDRVKDSTLADPSGTLLSPSEIDFVNRQIVEYGKAVTEGSKVLKKQVKETLALLPLSKESKTLVLRQFEIEEQSFAQAKKDLAQKQRSSKLAARSAAQMAQYDAEEAAARENLKKQKILDFEQAKKSGLIRAKAESAPASVLLANTPSGITRPLTQDEKFANVAVQTSPKVDISKDPDLIAYNRDFDAEMVIRKDIAKKAGAALKNVAKEEDDLWKERQKTLSEEDQLWEDRQKELAETKRREESMRSKIASVKIIRSGGGRRSTQEEYDAMIAAEQAGNRGVSSRTATGRPIEGGIDFGRNKDISRAFASRQIQEDRSVNLQAASERVQQGKKLSSAQLKAISTQSFVQALQSPSLAGLSNREIAVNPEARKELRRLAKEYRDQFGKALDSSQTSSALDRAFTPSRFSLSSIYRSEKGDMRSFQKELGLQSGAKLTPEQKNLFAARRMQAVQQRSGAASSAGFAGSLAASFAAPMVGGVGGDILSGIGVGLSAGALTANPLGLLAGGVAGAAYGTANAVQGAPERNFQKAAGEFQVLTAKIEENRNGVQQYIEAQARLNDTLKEGKASTEDIEKLNQNLTNVFRTIGDASLRKDIIAASGDLGKLQEVFSSFQKESLIKEAQGSIKVLTAAAIKGRANQTLGFGGDIQTNDLTKIGESLFTANNTKDGLSGFLSSIREIDKLASSGNAKKASEELAKLDPSLEKISEAVDIRIITSAALAFNEVSNQLKQTQEVNNDYLVQLAKYQKEYLKLSSELITRSRLTELRGESQNRLSLARIGEGIESSSFGSTERSMVGIRSQYRQAEIVNQYNTGRSELENGLRTSLQTFLGETGSGLSKKFNIESENPRELLNKLLKLSPNDLGSDPTEAVGKLDELRKAFDTQLGDLNRTNSEQLELEKISARGEEERIRRQNRIGMLGGANFSPLDFSAIQAGRGAATTRLRGEKILGGNIYGLDARGVRQSTQSARILETQGILARSELLPGLPTGDKDIATVGKAFEENLRGNLDQLVASSLKGLFSDQSLAQGGVSFTGGNLREVLFSSLSKSSKGGKTDFAGAAELVKTRLPDFGGGAEIKRQALEILNDAAKDQGVLGQAGKDQASSLLKTDAQKQDEFVAKLITGFRGEDIAKWTKETEERVRQLRDIFARQAGATAKATEANEQNRKVNNLIEAKGKELQSKRNLVSSAKLDPKLYGGKFLESRGTGALGASASYLSDSYSRAVMSASGKTKLETADTGDLINSISPLRKIFESSGTIKDAADKIVKSTELEQFKKIISSDPSNAQKTQVSIEKFLLSYSEADEKIRGLDTSVSSLDGEIVNAKTTLTELTKAAEDARKAFEEFAKSQTSIPAETSETSPSSSASTANKPTEFVSLTGKNGEAISVDPASLGYDNYNIKGSREDGSGFSTSNLNEESRKKAEELIATRFGMGGASGATENDGYSFTGNGRNRDPRIDQDMANSRMTGDTYDAFKAQQRNKITDIPELQRIRSFRSNQLFDVASSDGFKGKEKDRSNKIEEIKKILDSLDKRIAAAKEAEIAKLQEGGVAMAESFVASIGESLTPEFQATLKQFIDVKGSVVIKDGIKTAEEIVGLDAAILKVIEEYYNKKQKEKNDKITKETGGIPTPSVTPR